MQQGWSVLCGTLCSSVAGVSWVPLMGGHCPACGSVQLRDVAVALSGHCLWGAHVQHLCSHLTSCCLSQRCSHVPVGHSWFSSCLEPHSVRGKMTFPPIPAMQIPTCCENFASRPSGSVPAKCKMRRGSKRSISGAVLLCWGEHEAAEHPFRAQHTSRTACSALGRLLLPSQGHELPPGPGVIAVNEPCAQHR